MEDFKFFSSVIEFDDQTNRLIRESEDALASAYAPYSKFKVGAAVLLEDGEIIKGSNQENAAYPSGMCAERVALFSAAAQHKGKKIIRIAVVAIQNDGPDLLPVTPCGSCRQVMVEMESMQQLPFEVIMQIKTNQWVKARSAESLLPFSFTEANLIK